MRYVVPAGGAVTFEVCMACVLLSVDSPGAWVAVFVFFVEDRRDHVAADIFRIGWLGRFEGVLAPLDAAFLWSWEVIP